MQKILEWIDRNPIVWKFLIGVGIFSLILIAIAVFQGRETTVGPIKIGVKPVVTETPSSPTPTPTSSPISSPTPTSTSTPTPTPTSSPSPTTVVLTVTIESPKQEETIRTPVYNDMRGKYVGEIPDGYKLWVLAKDDYNYFIMYPPPSVVKNTKSWSQTNVRLATTGRWELYVCLANKAASQWLEDRAKRNDFSGFPSLPDGMETVQYVVVNRE